MPRISVTPPPGVFNNDTGFSTPGVWKNASNMRPYLGRMQTTGGWTKAFATQLTGVCRNTLAWVDNDAYDNIAFGTHSKLLVYKLGTLSDITPVGLTAGSIDGAGGPGYGSGTYGSGTYGTTSATGWYARTYSLQTYGQTLIANPRGVGIYQWNNNVATPAVIVTNAPTQVNNILVTPERQILAFGCNEESGGAFNQRCIRGCDIDDITDWTSTPENNAFEWILEGGAPGAIVGARQIGPYVAIWTTTGLHMGQFTSDTNSVYRFDPVAYNCGLAGPNAAVVFNGTAFWVTPDLQVYTWTPGAPPAPLKCPIRTDFAENMVTSQMEKIVATSVSEFGEIWFIYPDSRDGIECSRAIAYSIAENAWFPNLIARTAAIDSGPTRWPLFVSYGGTAYYHENGNTADGGALSWSLESSDFYLGEADQRFMIRDIWPDFEDQVGPISLTVNLKAYPQSTPRTKGPYTLETGRTRKDFLADGRIAAISLSGSSAPAFARLGKLSFDAEKTGLR